MIIPPQFVISENHYLNILSMLEDSPFRDKVMAEAIELNDEFLIHWFGDNNEEFQKFVDKFYKENDGHRAACFVENFK